MSQRGDHLSVSDVASDIASQIRTIQSIQVTGWAIETDAVTLLLANGQQFRIGQIQQLEERG